jgi:hypothetical protein
MNIVYGTTALIDPQTEYADSGWSINGSVAVHSGCNAGTMTYTGSFNFEVGKSYDISYVVSNYGSGLVRQNLGTSVGADVTSNKKQTDTLLCNTEEDKFQFYSDGALTITILQIVESGQALAEAETFAFDESANKWVGSYSYIPEMMVKFAGGLFSFNAGSLWEHETNATHGSFYGNKYPFQITFIVNPEFQKDKLYYNMRLDAKGKWTAPSLNVSPSNQFPNGMQSRLSKGNFKQIDGKLWADILNDFTDPNFASITDVNQRQVNALFKGRKMQGGWMVVELECNDDSNVHISSAEVYYTDTYRSI